MEGIAQLAGLLMMVGWVVAAIGGIMIVIAAFQRSIGWGLASLIIPFAAIVFLLKYWPEGKTGFMISLLGAALAIIGVIVVAMFGAAAEPSAMILPITIQAA